MEQNRTDQGRIPILWGGVLLAITVVCALGWFGASRACEKAQAEAQAAAQDAALAQAEAEAAARAAAETRNEAEAAAEIAVEAAARAVAPAAAEARRLLRCVLLGEDTLVTEEYGAVSIDDLTPGETNIHLVPYSLAVVDLDRDGIDEAVLGLGNRDNGLNAVTFGYMILHVQDGQVYGIPSVYRGLQDLKEDGTWYFSNSAFGPNGYGTMYFDGTARLDNDFLYFDSVRNSDDLQINYYFNGQTVTEEEYEAAEEVQQAKPDATWYDFTAENILALFP